MNPRVGLVGARRVRQGLGPFVARDLVAWGAEVPAFLATSAASRDQALEGLARFADVAPTGYTDLAAMLASESLDALAILSPSESHERFLTAALDAGLHVLTEKPFVWGGADLVARTRRLTDGFAARGLHLFENCQWPYTLPAFDALHPGVRARPPERFEMWMQPSSRGWTSLGDSVPHPLSLLQALVPGAVPRVEDVAFSTHDPESPALTLRFRYRTDAHACEATLHLEEVAACVQDRVVAVQAIEELLAFIRFHLVFPSESQRPALWESGWSRKTALGETQAPYSRSQK